MKRNIALNIKPRVLLSAFFLLASMGANEAFAEGRRFCELSTEERKARIDEIAKNEGLTPEFLLGIARMNQSVDSVEALTCLALGRYRGIPLIVLDRLEKDVVEMHVDRLAQLHEERELFSQKGYASLLTFVDHQIESEIEGHARLLRLIKKAKRKND